MTLLMVHNEDGMKDFKFTPNCGRCISESTIISITVSTKRRMFTKHLIVVSSIDMREFYLFSKKGKMFDINRLIR